MNYITLRIIEKQWIQILGVLENINNYYYAA